MLVALLAACSTLHGVRPLGEGGLAVEASLGGPIVELFGAPIPLPITTVGAAYGFTDQWEAHAAIHPTTAALFGVVMFEVGGTWHPLPQDGARPRISADLTLVNGAGDVDPDTGKPGGYRLFVQPTAVFAWDWGKDARHTFYAAPTMFLQPFPDVKAHGAVAVGGRWGLGPAVGLTTELKWIDPWANTEVLAPNYYLNAGALSFQLGLDVRFGGAR